MRAPTILSGPQLRTYERIYQHPISHNLGWHDVLGMFRQLGTVEDEPNGKLKVTRNGQHTILHPNRTKDVVENDEVVALRHFLQLTEAKETDDKPSRWLVVIDHHEARLFRSEMSGTVPVQILPHEPSQYFRHAHHSLQFARGAEKPDPNTYFEPLAKALAGADQILVFGTGTGMSNEMDQFTGWLRKYHAELALRVIGSVVIDEHHLTEGQLLKKAREFHEAFQAKSV